MYELIVLISIGLAYCFTITAAETEYFPGLRKPPQLSNWNGGSQKENAYLLAQINSIIEEETRRRFQNKLQLHQQKSHQHGPSAPQEIAAPGFTYQFQINSSPIDIEEPITFAVSPADQRYYELSPIEKASRLKSNLNDLQHQDASGHDDIPSTKLKAPMEVKPQINTSSKSRDVMTREDLKSLVEKLHKTNQEEAILNTNRYIHQQPNDVIKKYMDMDAAMGIYVVALIAGVSAALTVGLIALGIGWYTLHKKGLAAADVEYPAYGVTGPNKDCSPSGDRRLAQSAQMYHYQHQKQQIIAMENGSNNERCNNGSLSDVESDDENEEGDYTVYECPGLAPTGEMEVKNPLFLDDPTPATPANLSTTPQQPPTNILQTTTTVVNETGRAVDSAPTPDKKHSNGKPK